MGYKTYSWSVGRELLKRLETLEAVRDAAETLVYWLTRRGIANTSSELERLRAALDVVREASSAR